MACEVAGIRLLPKTEHWAEPLLLYSLNAGYYTQYDIDIKVLVGVYKRLHGFNRKFDIEIRS